MFLMQVKDDQRYQASSTEAVDRSSDTQGAQKENYVGTLEDAVLHNTNQFHKWHSELETACASEMEEKYKRYADLLNSHLRSSEGILGQVSGLFFPGGWGLGVPDYAHTVCV